MEKVEVLLVEDKPTLAMIIKDTLDRSELDATLAANGEEGLSRCAETNPDIIVADVITSKMGGLVMVKLVRKADTHTPVLFLSVRSTINDAIEGLEAGGNDYLKKPFGMAELIVRVRALLHRVSVQRLEVTSSRIGFYTLDSITRTLIYRGEKQLLSNRGPGILKRLCDNKDQVLPTKEVLTGL